MIDAAVLDWVSIHEAAHGCAAIYYDLALDDLDLRRPDWEGLARAHLTYPRNVEGARGYVVACLIGEIAQRRASPGSPLGTERTDEELARKVVAEFPELDLEECRREAADLVVQLWPDIVRVARRLSFLGVLQGHEVRMLMFNRNASD